MSTSASAPTEVESGPAAVGATRRIAIFIAAGASRAIPAGDYGDTITIEIVGSP